MSKAASGPVPPASTAFVAASSAMQGSQMALHSQANGMMPIASAAPSAAQGSASPAPTPMINGVPSYRNAALRQVADGSGVGVAPPPPPPVPMSPSSTMQSPGSMKDTHAQPQPQTPNDAQLRMMMQQQQQAPRGAAPLGPFTAPVPK
eukprot:scaffold682173_cov50-Prasinocladus_malaysianus.AAC.1